MCSDDRVMTTDMIQALTSKNTFFLMAGTCVIEGRDLTLKVADYLVSLCQKLEIPLVYKGSFRKANRTRLDSFTGIGDQNALEILREIGNTFGIPTMTDIHEPQEAELAAEYVDVLQIPAFLCRQTDLIVAAANTGKVINLKKGQFLAPTAMKFVVDKVVQSGNNKIILTERGTTFGYQDLIVDFRSIPEMQSLGFPVVMDVTHSLQQPNLRSGITGGIPKYIDTLASAAIAVGADGLFIETHPEPSKALSDGANMLPLKDIEKLLRKAIRIKQAIANQ